MNNKIALTQYQKEVLNGCLLGDGGLFKQKNSVNFYYNSKIYNTVNKIHEIFYNFITPAYINGPKTIETYDKRTNKTYIFNMWRSQCNISFNEIYDKWYNIQLKYIPKDIILTPITCLWWYIGDGSISEQGIKLSTNCFNIDDLNNIIIPQLKQFNAKIYIVENKPIIIIPRRKNKLFLNYIGECIIPELKYKWNIIPYKNKNIEINGFNYCDNNTIIQILKLFNDKYKPYEIAKFLNIHITTVKNQLKKEKLFESNIEDNRLKSFKVISPNNIEYTITNLTKFCKEQNLSTQAMHAVACNKRNHHKKWTCFKLN